MICGQNNTENPRMLLLAMMNEAANKVSVYICWMVTFYDEPKPSVDKTRLILSILLLYLTSAGADPAYKSDRVTAYKSDRVTGSWATPKYTNSNTNRQ